MQYYRDVDKGNIVRKPDEGMYLEYISLGSTEWRRTERDDSYEREYWLGEGNTCLFDLSEDNALKIIKSWQFAPTIEQIKTSKECYVFGGDTLYIVPDSDADVFVLDLVSGVWRLRESSSFWDSWDGSPMLFETIDKSKAVALSINPKKQKVKEYVDFPDDRILNSSASGFVSEKGANKPENDGQNIVSQLVNGIMGKESENPTEREKELRKRLSGRAMEYLMFMDDDDEAEEVKTEPITTANIIVFPDFEKLKEKVERLRTELSMLLLERDELQFVICRNIETAYMLELGSLEYKAYEAQCTFLRLKRKLELIQAKINRQEKVILSKIEDTLDQEFAEYQQKLDEQINKMNEAIEHSKGRPLTDEENKELKKTYRKIVKSLHPDLNPNITESQKQLFENAVEAYKHGNLEMLKIIGEMVSEPTVPEKSVDAMTMLKENADSLEKMVSVIQENISDIKSRYPYTMKDIIEDKEKIEQRRTEIQSILEQYNDGISLYQTKIDELMRC